MAQDTGSEGTLPEWMISSQTSVDAWDMPSRGIKWCDCGEDHELTEDFVFNTLIDIGLQPTRMLTHPELIELTAAVWNYEEVCRFFELAVEESAKAIHGGVDEFYPLRHTLQIVGYFSKAWQGCPEADCQL